MSGEIEENKYEGFDRVFPLIGGRHRYQWQLLGVVSMQAALFALHHMGYVFLGAVPDHWCQIDELQQTGWSLDEIKNISIPRESELSDRFAKCEYYDLNYEQLKSSYNYADAYASVDFTHARTLPCTKWAYDKTIYISTTVTQFDLVCGRRHLVATIQATYMSGVFFGSFSGALSDRILGRRRTVLVSVALVILAGFGAAFSTSYWAFVTFRLFIAIGVTGSYQNCFTLLIEYSDTSYRAIMAMIQTVPFALGYMMLPVYAYLLRDWAHLQMAFTLSCLTLISYYWTFPESSRWLASKGREKEALQILQKIAKTNNMPELNIHEVLEILESCQDGNVKKFTAIDTPKFFCTNLGRSVKDFFGNYLSLVRTPELRKRSIILWILFISVTLVYYGVSFDSALLTDDPFVLVFLGGLMEVPGYLGVAPLATKWGRTPTVATTFLLSGVCSLGVAVTPLSFTTFRVIFSMAGKLFISGCFGVIYLLGTELYPTSARVTGLGAAALMGRVGSISAPYVVNGTKHFYSDMPSIIFGVTGILAGLVAFFLPETMDVEMEESVKAIELRRASVSIVEAIITRKHRKSLADICEPHVELDNLNPNPNPNPNVNMA